MITHVEFVRFRGFAHLQADLQPHAYIVGPNSAGKSTVLEAIALAEQCLRIARRKMPSLMVKDMDRHVRAFPIRPNLDEEEDPVRYEFGPEETRLSIHTGSGACIRIVWPEEGEDGARAFFYLDDGSGGQPRTLANVRELFQPVTVIPVITPLDRVEELKNPTYVEAKNATRLASRHFRNHLWLMAKSSEWNAFKTYCRPWLPEIELLDVNLDMAANRIAVFYSEVGSRVPKELAWAGDGIQIWVQLLWHLYRAQAATTVVLDEPEVYLHPDLQRRLVRLLDGMSAQIVLASHSADVIAEAPNGAVLWVDRRTNNARRPKSQQSLSNLSDSLGSSFNLALARSLRTRLVVASDSEDIRILRLLARHVGASDIANEHTVSVVALRAVGTWSAASQLGKSLREVLPPELPAVVLLQAGYRPKDLNERIIEQLSAPGVTVKFWSRPELENYLLDVETIARVSGSAPEMVALQIREACVNLRAHTRAAFTSCWVGSAHEGMGRDALLHAERIFDDLWADASRWSAIVPGTHVIRELNMWLESCGYRPISGYALAKAMKPQNIPSEVYNLLFEINEAVS